MKRMNRKKIIDTLETSRSGYTSLILKSKQINDEIMYLTCKSHHKMLNDLIVELGGENVESIL